MMSEGNTDRPAISVIQDSSSVSMNQTGQNVASGPSISSESVDMTGGSVGKIRVPRRTLHFSDGVLEEYSTDEDEQQQVEDEVDGAASRPPQALVKLRQQNPKSMHWMPWAWYWLRVAGLTTVYKLDAVGEKLAYMFGITSPKYQHELEEYFEQKRHEEEEQKRHQLESAGWTSESALTNDQSTNQQSTAAANVSSTSLKTDQPITSPPTSSNLV